MSLRESGGRTATLFRQNVALLVRDPAPIIITTAMPLILIAFRVAYTIMQSVNGRLLQLNKSVNFGPDGANYPVKAVEITRTYVVLEAGGQKTKLELEPSKPATSSQGK